MTKTATPTTLAVGSLVAGYPVVADDALAVLEQLNWSHQERTCELLIADDRTDELPTTGGFVERRRLELWIDPDVAEVEVATLATVTAANEITLRTTIGGDSIDQVIDAAHSGVLHIDTMLTSATGTGWQTVTLEIEHGTGSAADCTRDLWQIQCARTLAGDQPSPQEG